MSEFIIPTKQPIVPEVVSVPDLETGDCEFIEGLHPALLNKVKVVFIDHNHKTRLSIYRYVSSMEKDNIEFKTRYAKDINACYQLLLTDISNSFSSDKKILACEIIGRYESCYKERNISYWAECNPGKYAAVEITIDELRGKGWSPKISLSYDQDIDEDDGMRSGGDKLIFTCDFTD